MPEETPVESPVEKPRSKRIYVYWGVALALLLGLGLFCWKVVVPVMETGAVLREDYFGAGRQSIGYPWNDQAVATAIKRLGGPKAAAWRIGLYLRVSRRPDLHRHNAARILGNCGKHAVPTLVRLMRDENMYVSFRAVASLGLTGSPRAFEPLMRALKSDDHITRYAAAGALGRLGDDRAVGALTSALEQFKYV